MTNRQHIKAKVIDLIEQSIDRRIASATGMTDEIRAKLEALKAKTLHVAHQQPAEFFESCWTDTDATVVKLAMAKLAPLCK